MSGVTPNIGLNVPDHGDQNWDVPVNQNWNTLDTAIAGKQATLTFDSTPTSGSNNPVTSGGIYSAIQAVTPSVDNKSVDYNGSSQLEAVGVINRRDTSIAVKTWTGTKAQYDAIVSKDTNTLYNITDDTDVSLTILEALYPVGSIYITTADTCPLSVLISGSTWTLVSSGRVLQGADGGHSAGTTIEAGLPNIYTEIATRKYEFGIGPVASVSGAGTFNNDGYTAASNAYAKQGGTTSYQLQKTTIDASVGNPIYGNSSTVQPPAYVVNIYRRTA